MGLLLKILTVRLITWSHKAKFKKAEINHKEGGRDPPTSEFRKWGGGTLPYSPLTLIKLKIPYPKPLAYSNKKGKRSRLQES